MKVETFETTEIGMEGKIENFEETKQLCDKLELKGQQKFLNGETKQVTPYRKITAQEKLVYSTICSKTTNLNDYDDAIVPLRILQVGAHAMETGLITELVVWHCPNGDVKDPVLIGRKKKGSYDYEDYLLARWGEELEPFSELSKKALDILKLEARASLQKEALELKNAEANLDTLVESSFAKGSRFSASFYCS